MGMIFCMNNKLKLDLEQPIVMVGLMGAGKTSVGRALARKLGVPFVDSDKEIEAAAGCSVVDIFAMYGEAEFRRVEQRIICNFNFSLDSTCIFQNNIVICIFNAESSVFIG